MAVRGQKTKLKTPLKKVTKLKSNQGPAMGGSIRGGKQIKSAPEVPLGGSIPPKNNKILSTYTQPIGHQQTQAVSRPKKPKINIKKTSSRKVK